MTRLRVLIVDDQLRARQSLRALLATVSEIESVAEAANGSQAVRLVRESPPDVVIMDVRMPELDGLKATRQIQASAPHVRVIVLTLYQEYRHAALEAGAAAFLIKGAPGQELINAVLAKSD